MSEAGVRGLDELDRRWVAVGYGVGPGVSKDSAGEGCGQGLDKLDRRRGRPAVNLRPLDGLTGVGSGGLPAYGQRLDKLNRRG